MKKLICILIIILSICIINKISAYTEYKVGDEVTYNNVDYYVIKDSSSKEISVTMLKAEPLTVEEVNNYGTGHVNRYTYSSVGTAYNLGGYGGIAYYTSETCRYSNNYDVDTGCTSDYADSDIKYVIDAWKDAEAPKAIEARLIQYGEFENLGYVEGQVTPSNIGWLPSETTPSWVYNSSYYYWAMTPVNDSISIVWGVNSDGSVYPTGVKYYYHTVRPVIVLSKNELGDEDESVIEEKDESDGTKENKIEQEENKNSEKSVSSKVKVANTYMSEALNIIVVGFIASVLSMLIFYKYVNKKV